MKTKPKNLSATSSSAPPRANLSGWQTVKLGEVCLIKPPKSEARDHLAPDSEVSFVPMEDLGIGEKLFRVAQTKRLSEVEGSYTYFAEGDVLLAKITPCFENGKLGIARGLTNGVGFGSSEFIVFRPNVEVDREWLYYWLSREAFRLEGATRMLGSVGHKRVAKDFIEGCEMPLPPLPEQRRIVGILDEALAEIAAAKAHAERNRQNARALFESHLHAVFSHPGPGWAEKPFEDLIESNLIGLTRSSREQGDDKRYPYVKMNHITRENRFDFSEYVKVDATPEEVARFALRAGDFLFNTRNSHELVGKSCIYEGPDDETVLFNNNIMRVRFRSGVEARFVLMAFSSREVAAELEAMKSGTTNVAAIYYKDLRTLKIPLPPVREQQRIANELDALAAETRRLEGLYERKAAALDELKQSLLHQAFSGGFDRLSHRSGE